MLDRLSRQRVPPGDEAGDRPLERLTTRDPADPAIALLDGCATLLDVLTFYQERLANEGFLRTSTERRSILELARLIGYELGPGVAASADLAFRLEVPGVPLALPSGPNGAGAGVVASGEATDRVVVPVGTQVKSVPGPDQSSQTFETVEEIEGRPVWNDLSPRLTRPQDLALRDDSETPTLYFLGLNTDLGSGAEEVPRSELFPLGDAQIPAGNVRGVPLQTIYADGTDTRIEKGDRILFVGKRPDEAGGEVPFETKTLVQTVRRVTADETLKRTRIDFAEQPTLPTFSPLVYTPGQMQLAMLTLQDTTLQQTVGQQTWSESDLSVLFGTQGWDPDVVTTHINTAHLFGAFAAFATTPPPPRPEIHDVEPGVFVFREKLGFFGHNAPAFRSLPEPLRSSNVFGDWDTSPPSIWEDSHGNPYTGADTFLERVVEGLTDRTWVVFRGGDASGAFWVTGVAEQSLADFALSAKTTGLALAGDDGVELTAETKPEDLGFRSTTAHVLSEEVQLARLPIADLVEAGVRSIQLDGLHLGLNVGRKVAITGERADLAGVITGEALTLTEVEHAGGFTTLHFEPELEHSYVRDTVSINANVAPATHGETVVEVLGSGDGSVPHQRFTLKRAGLTHVPASTAEGSESTLEVRVDDVLWNETPGLFGLSADDERYALERNDDGDTTVRFGDGRVGARLPTGAEVRARYRVGIGAEGVVGRGTLTLLQSKPLGVGSVMNPAPAYGAEDPETRDDARQNAPRTVLTLDRVVSLRDYEDFARSFAGIGKARADLISANGRRWVQLTVASAAPPPGALGALAPRAVATDLRARLVDAIRRHGDPAQRFEVASYRPLFFNVRAEVLVDPRHELERVSAETASLLRERFSFEHRSFGRPVAAAEVITTMHRAAGVVAVDLDQFYAYAEGEQAPDPSEEITPELLAAPAARWDPGSGGVAPGVLPATLLLINPAGIDLVPAFAPAAATSQSGGGSDG